MFKTKADAAEFARGHSAFIDEVWNPETEWTEAYFGKRMHKDMVHVWQGQIMNGIKGLLAHWGPVQGAFVGSTTFGFDIETFAENMVVFKQYVTWKSFEGKDVFIVWRFIVNVDNDGKIVQETYVLDQKYADAVAGVLGAFAKKNGIET